MPLPKTYLMILLQLLQKLLSLTLGDVMTGSNVDPKLRTYLKHHIADRKSVLLIFTVSQFAIEELRTHELTEDQQLYISTVDRYFGACLVASTVLGKGLLPS